MTLPPLRPARRPPSARLAADAALRWMRAALVALAAAAAGTLAHGQDAATSATDTAPAARERAPAPIALVDILARAEEDHQLAEIATARGSGPPAAPALERRLDELKSVVDGMTKTQQIDELRRLPVVGLEGIARRWEFEARRFEHWQDDMRQAFAPYLDDAARLTQRRTQWEATRAQAEARGLPAALAERVDTMVAELSAAEQALSPALARQINLGQRASVVDSRIRSGTATVNAAIADIDRRLLHNDAPALWSPRATGSGKELQSVRRGIELEMDFAREYASGAVSNRVALATVQGLLLVLLLWLWLHHRRAGPPPEGGPDDASTRVLARPLSAWLLLSMLAVFALESDAPIVTKEVAMAIALVPMLRLLPPRSVRMLGLWPYGAIVAMYLLDRSSFVLMGSPYLYRLFKLALALLALLFVLWLRWRLRRHGAEPGPRRAAVSALAALAAVLLGAACVANVLGNVSLAEMLTAGVIDSSYFGLLLYAGVVIAVTLLKLVLQSPLVAQTDWARAQGPAVIRLVGHALRLAALVGWALYTMDAFRLLRPGQALLAALMSYNIEAGALSLSVGNVLVFALSVLIAVAVARVTRVLLRDHLLNRESLPRGVGNSVASLTYYAILLLGFLIALTAAGFQVGQLAIVLGALGVGIGLGLQNIVGNFVAGLVLIFERPIQPGDTIDIPGVSGTVRDIGMRATTIRTFDGADVVVPNGTLTAANLTNWTLFDQRRRIEIAVGVAYGTDPARVFALLETAARQTPGVASSPSPVVMLTGYGESSLDFVLQVWTNQADRWALIRSDLRTRVLQTLTQAGIEIPYRQVDLNLRGVTDAAAAALQPARRTPAPGDGGAATSA